MPISFVILAVFVTIIMFIPPINVAIFSRTHIHQMIMKIIIIVNGKCEIYKFFLLFWTVRFSFQNVVNMWRLSARMS